VEAAKNELMKARECESFSSNKQQQQGPAPEGDESPALVTVLRDSAREQANIKAEEEEAPCPELSDEQIRAFHVAMEGKNVFITGRAGVGKSFLVDQACSRCLEAPIPRLLWRLIALWPLRTSQGFFRRSDWLSCPHLATTAHHYQ